MADDHKRGIWHGWLYDRAGREVEFVEVVKPDGYPEHVSYKGVNYSALSSRGLRGWVEIISLIAVKTKFDKGSDPAKGLFAPPVKKR